MASVDNHGDVLLRQLFGSNATAFANEHLHRYVMQPTLAKVTEVFGRKDSPPPGMGKPQIIAGDLIYQAIADMMDAAIAAAPNWQSEDNTSHHAALQQYFTSLVQQFYSAFGESEPCLPHDGSTEVMMPVNEPRNPHRIEVGKDEVVLITPSMCQPIPPTIRVKDGGVAILLCADVASVRVEGHDSVALLLGCTIMLGNGVQVLGGKCIMLNGLVRGCGQGCSVTQHGTLIAFSGNILGNRGTAQVLVDHSAAILACIQFAPTNEFAYKHVGVLANNSWLCAHTLHISGMRVCILVEGPQSNAKLTSCGFNLSERGIEVRSGAQAQTAMCELDHKHPSGSELRTQV